MATTRKTLTKQDIENMATSIMTALVKMNMAEGTVIYFNNKKMYYKFKEIVVDDGFNPHDYFEYCAYHHIMSMSFDGSELYDYINNYGEFPSKIKLIFNKYKVYSELGNSWNCSIYPTHDDMKVEYTEYKEPVSTTYLHLGSWEDGDEIFQSVMMLWKEFSKKIGDIGSCVIGAGFSFEYNKKPYFMSPSSNFQGSISWETDKDKIATILGIIGCTNIKYNWGHMD